MDGRDCKLLREYGGMDTLPCRKCKGWLQRYCRPQHTAYNKGTG